MNGISLLFDPLIPSWAMIAATVAAAAFALLNLAARLRGAWLRALALGFFVLALANPSFSREDRETLPNVVAVVMDRSASQGLAERPAQAMAARAALEERLKGLRNTEVRFVEAGQTDRAADGTQLFAALAGALADVPPDRVGGVLLVTDGIVHDIPARAAALGFTAPIHTLLTGRPDERDRRVVLVEAPRFGIVGRTQSIGVRVLDQGPSMPPTATLVVRRDGEEVYRQDVPVGAVSNIEVAIAHGGQNIIEIEASPVEGELSDVNNRAVLGIEGVRDKMRVLLVSGEPHAGERTWRNLLKADANVDLVHFTILRPPQKQDGTPVTELSLIAFPVRQLFDEKLSEFDLVVFDRYAQQGILPALYFSNLVDYVRRGGAVLLASGPDYAGEDSLWFTPLSEILPVEPTGGILEEPFRATLNEAGKRHPVTRDLPGANAVPPQWSEWYRTIESTPRSGTALMTGARDMPLLVLDRQGEGRVAVLLSDHAWLWARGYQGGGPHVDLLRRLSHWLMKEPELEEEALRARMAGNDLVIERQTMKDSAEPFTVTGPTGERVVLTPVQDAPGRWRAAMTPPVPGLYRATDGTLSTLVNVGPPDPREFQELVSTAERLTPLATETGGAVRRLTQTSGVTVPRLSLVSAAGPFAGEGWIGVKEASVTVVRGVGVLPLFAGLLGLALLLGALAVTWAREGR